jgi:hypothetical protein
VDAGSGTHDGIVERVIRESDGAAQYPTLTRTNYSGWALVVKVQLQAQGMWDAVPSRAGRKSYRDGWLGSSAFVGSDTTIIIIIPE